MDEEIDGLALPRQLLQELRGRLAEPICRITGIEVRRELGIEPVRITERHLLHAVVEEEVERVHRIDLDADLDDQLERGHALPCLERDARDVVPVGVALPVHPVFRGDGELVALDPRMRVIRGPQPDDLGPQQRRAAVDVPASVLDQQTHRKMVVRLRTLAPVAAEEILREVLVQLEPAVEVACK